MISYSMTGPTLGDRSPKCATQPGTKLNNVAMLGEIECDSVRIKPQLLARTEFWRSSECGFRGIELKKDRTMGSKG